MQHSRGNDSLIWSAAFGGYREEQLDEDGGY